MARTPHSPWYGRRGAPEAPPPRPEEGAGLESGDPSPFIGDYLTTDFAGRRGRLFWLALKTGIWTVLTLGFYRFWTKTRLRRWYWSSIRVGGHPAEYVGDPFEKLVGFFFAVVILAFYIGIVNLLLMFGSFALFQGNGTAYLLSFLGVIPIWFFARYRARRYVLARTRWRGIRLGLLPGAWGYAGRALWHWGLAIVTLGLLWPRRTFYLTKYMTDRTCFGDVTLTQGGDWRMLFKPFVPVIAGILLGAGAGVVLGFELTDPQVGLGLVLLSVLVLSVAIPHYIARSWHLLVIHVEAPGVTFKAAPRSLRVMWIYGFGYSLVAVISLILFVGFVLGLVFALAAMMGSLGALEADEIAAGLYDLPLTVQLVFSLSIYFGLFTMWSTLTHVFVRMPLWRHYAETFGLVDMGGLPQVAQRARDEFGEAEGFADALDVGAAI